MIYRLLILSLLLVASLVWAPTVVVAKKIESYVVKSIYIHNFVRFVTFPHISQQHMITFCTLGDDPFGSSLDRVAKESPLEVNLTIQRSVSLREIKNCNMVFISQSERKLVTTILGRIKGLPILTISEMRGFVDQGGMVQFLDSSDGGVKLVINQKEAKSSGIKINTMLLEVAARVVR